VIELPDSLLNKKIIASLKRGVVLRTKITLSGNRFFKRLIILNKDFNEGKIYFILSTSQVTWYKAHKAEAGVAGHFLFLPIGTTPSNPTEDMVINLREVFILPIAQLINNLRANKLQFLPSMPDQAMKDIDRIISVSKLIPQGIKNKILP